MQSPSSSSSSSGAGTGAATSAHIDAIIAEAADICTLEQIAALNTAHLPADAAILPSDVEARFRTLKTFPARRRPQSFDAQPERPRLSPIRARKSPKDAIFNAHEPELRSKSDLGGEKDGELGAERAKMASKFDLGCSPSISVDSWGELASPSPSTSPKGRACFGCFAVKRKKAKKDDEILSEFGTLSLKREQRRLKRALKEQEKLNRDAERMVRWVKQVSAKMTVDMIDEEIGDSDEEFK